MNTVKDYVTIHLQLNQIDVLEVNKICVPNKTEDLNLNVFNMIAGINESKKITKHISCKCERKFYSRKCNSNQKWNNDKGKCESKNFAEHHVCEKDYFESCSTCGNGCKQEVLLVLLTIQ